MPPLRPFPPLALATVLLAGCASARETAATPPPLQIRRPDPRPDAVVLLPRRLAPGVPLTGRIPPGSTLSADGRDIPVAADGGVDWPVPAGTRTLRLRVRRPDGRVVVQQVRIDAR
jgi:hypothetical protein